MSTTIIKCTCKHEFQDSVYGIGNRVGNETQAGQYRCVVCGAIGGAKATVIKMPVIKTEPKVEVKPDKEPDKKAKRVSKDMGRKTDKPAKPDKKASMKGGKR